MDLGPVTTGYDLGGAATDNDGQYSEIQSGRLFNQNAEAHTRPCMLILNPFSQMNGLNTGIGNAHQGICKQMNMAH